MMGRDMQDKLGAAERGRWAVAAMFLVNGFIMGAWAPQIPLLLPRHHITETTLGLMILLLGTGAVGAMLFAGKLIARLGSRRMVVLFGVLSVPMLPLVVAAPNLWLLGPAMMIMGAVIGTMDVSMNANAVEVEHRLGRAIMSSSHGFWSLGGFFGGGVGGVVLARYGAGSQSLGVALLSAVILLIAARFLISEQKSARVDDLAKPRKIAMFPRASGLYVLGTMALFSMIPEGATLDWAALYLNKELGADLGRSGLAFAFFAGSMAMMRFLGDAVRNRFGAVKTLRLSAFAGTAGMMIAAIAPNDSAAIAGFALCGLGVANMVPILFSAAGNFAGIGPGAGIATVTMMGYSGILIAPSTIGFAAEHIGYRITFGVMACLMLGVAFLAGRAGAADGARLRAALAS